jgi:hypothetical protein
VDFIEMTATSFLRQAFSAELVGIWHIDLAGAGSYCLADSPAPPEAFHGYAVQHPIVGELVRSGALAPFKGLAGTGAAAGAAPGARHRPGGQPSPGGQAVPGPAGAGSPGGFVLAIPLAIDDRHARLIAIARLAMDFTPRELQLAGHLQPILAGVWAAGL